MTAVAAAVPRAAVPARRARATLRLAGFAGWTALCAGAWCLLRAARALVAPSGRWERAAMRRWALGVLHLLGVRVSVRGRPPRPPFVLVANHLGYLDIAVLASALDARFVAKREVRDWPGLGALAALVGTLFIDRARPRDAVRVDRAIGRALAEGDGIVLFAEGTSTDGRAVRPVCPALLEGAAREGLPVRVATLRYATGAGDPPAGRAVCWWGAMTFLPHFRALCGLGGIHAELRFADEAVRAPTRRALAGAAHAALIRHFTPTTGPEAA